MLNKLPRAFIVMASLWLIPMSFQPLFALDIGHASVVKTSQININNADLSHLSMIKGIGSKKAQEIIDYRNAHGPFVTLQALTNVKGIGQSTLTKITPFVTL